MKIIFIYMSVVLISCSSKQIGKADKALLEKAQLNFESLPKTMIDKEQNKAVIRLGRKLYLEKKLSFNNQISCNSCHRLDNYGVDNEVTSPGHDGTRGGRNSPTSFNAALNFKQFWDGRAKDLATQAIGPILNPIEHGLKTDTEALSKINTQEYVAMFKSAFPDQIIPFSFQNIGVAIGEFEKTLMTPAPFDEYLTGNINALNTKQKRGLSKFIEIGCVHCHNGAGLGGSSFKKLGVVKKYKTKDLGRKGVTKKNRDKFKFKVPLLRNIAKTAPYFHDGSIKTLESAIQIMGEYQLGMKISKTEISDIKAFLESLTGKLLK